MHGSLTPTAIARSITGKKKIHIVKFYIFFKQIRRIKRTLDIYRYGVETTTLSEIKLRSTAHTTKVISHIFFFF